MINSELSGTCVERVATEPCIILMRAKRVSELRRRARRWGPEIKGFLRNIAEDSELDTL